VLHRWGRGEVPARIVLDYLVPPGVMVSAVTC
jgi:hypothetical protein